MHGERRVFDVLRRLPDDCIVYYEPKVAGRNPDFVVIMPAIGVLVIEVKDWYAGAITRADPNVVDLRTVGVAPETTVQHPGRQAQAYMYDLMGAARDSSHASTLIHRSGRRRGHFVFPFAELVVFSRIGSSPKAAIRNWDQVFSPKQTVYSSTLNDWADLAGDALLDVIKERFRVWWDFDALSQEQINALRSIVHPELVIPSLSFPATNEDELRILDLHQERQVRQIGGGHRILYGIAGSGKTVLLIARAKFFAQIPNYEVLMLCRNRPLARHLSTITQHSQIHPQTFHAWGTSLGVNLNKFVDDEAFGEGLLHRLNELPNRKRYDAVLIDEGQDFPASWFKCAKAALKDPEDGNLMIVLDAAQSLYKRSGYTWSSVGISATGRTLSKNFGLNQNYRNTREILAAAAPFCSASDGDEDNPHLSMAVDPSLATRNGSVPNLVKQVSAQAECEAVVKCIAELVEEHGTDPSNIAIVYQGIRPDWNRLHGSMIASLEKVAPVLHVRAAHEWKITERGVRVMNIHQSKGLQFRHVFLIWLRLIPSQDETTQRRVLYVGLTRAEETLTIFYHQRSKFSALLEAHCKCFVT
ncbi:MAG: 3'-5' exonuclease [Hyphomicrobiaceae bacterium]